MKNRLSAWGPVVWLCGATLLGAWLRTQTLGESLWIDELHTAWTVADTLDHVAPRARLGNNSPLYFYGVWFVSQMYGANEWSLRLLSVVAGTALIPLTWFVARRWSCSAAMSCLAATLVAVDDHFLFFAQEARTYALVQVAAVGHVYLFSRLLTHPTAGCRLGWIASGVLLFHLHYTTALVVAAEIACYGILRGLTRYRPSYSPTSLLVDVGAWILLCAPASNHLLQIAERRSNWKSFVHDRPPWAILTIFPLPTYLAVPALFVASSWALRQAGSRRSFLLWRNGGERQAEQLGSPNQKRLPTHSAQPATTLLLTCCWLFVPLCLAWLSTRTDVARLFFRRYLMASSPAPALLAALIGNRASQGMALPVCAITLGVAVFTMGPFHRLARPGPWLRHSREDWRAAIRHVNESGEQDQVPVFLRSGLIEADQWYDAEDDLLRTYCLLPVRGIYKLAPRYQHIIPLPTTNSGSLSREHIALIAGQGGAWLVLRGRKQTADDIERQVLARLGAWRGRVVQRREFGNVTVVRLSDE